jgi:uracil-DNA glycosylase
MIEPLPRCEENPDFCTTFLPHLTLPGFFPGAGGFFPGHANANKRILIFGTDFGQLDYQQSLQSPHGETHNQTIVNLTKILTGAGVSLDECFLTNSVLCTWKVDRCLDNHAVWRRYPEYVKDCAEWHLQFIEQHKPDAVVLMGTPALETFGKVLYKDLGVQWKGRTSLKAIYDAGLETYQVPLGPKVLLMPHASLWYLNAKRFPIVAARAIQHLQSLKR